MRHQVDIKLPSTSTDARFGQRTGIDSTILADVPADVEQLTGLELIRARKIYPETTHRVTIWGDPSVRITSRHVVVFNGRNLYVGGVVDLDSTGIKLELLCREAI